MDIDGNTIATGAVVELTKSFFSELKKQSLDFFSKQYSYLFEDFSHYLSITYNRCNYVRTIINKEKSFEINEIYVPGSFVNDNLKYSDLEVISKIRECEPTVILGFGGIGKTVFTKYIWLSVFSEPKGKIPLYLELRKLNGITDLNLTAYIRRTISPGKSGIDEGVFSRFLKDGQFIFIFDGFDELSVAKKESLSSEIIEMSYEYPKNGYVISSRHDDRFSSWQRFKIFKACSFDKSQVSDLIDKVPYDKDTKKKFSAEIISKKYGSYETFLSTPLLTLMMLMTFSQFAEVPDKRHIFYRYAFMTLYSWHDSSKESFNREKQTGLVLDQFEKAFSIFCLISYLGRDYEFDERSIRDYILQVKKYVEFDFDVEKFQTEMMETVNLIYRDGESYLFTHRSFQEYFSAHAVVNYFQHKMMDIVPRLFRGSDMVLGLMYEINKVVVDENYILPSYAVHKEEIASIISKRIHSDVEKALDLRFVAVFEQFGGKRLLPSIFGREVKASSWIFVSHLRGFFETVEGIGSIVSTPVYENFRIDIFEAVAEEIRKSIKFNKKHLVTCYCPHDSRIYYAIVDNVSITSMDEEVEDIVASDTYIVAENRKLREMAKRECINLKAIYVACEKTIRDSERLRKQKDRGIDEILL